MKKCNIEGCEEQHKAKGYCNNHYRKFLKYGNPLAKGKGRKRGVCSLEGCEEPHEALGYCNKHYQRFKKYGDPHEGARIRNICEVEGCDRYVKSNMMCSKHYDRFRKYGDVHKVKRWNHGMSKTDIYLTWLGIRKRCKNKNLSDYKDYGGRGIKICEEWDNDFFSFYNYMGDVPKDMSIDRIDPNGNYEPGNVRWADSTTQARNKRISPKNKTGCIGVSWCERDKLYRAYISINGKTKHLYSSKSKEQCIAARLRGELKYWGYIYQKHLMHYLNDH